MQDKALNINNHIQVRRLTSDEGHYFFGYYDVPAWSADRELHLCHRVDFMDRLPDADDVAELGTVRLSDGVFVPFSETTAWNFQQGAMLQWLPGFSDEVIFNRRKGERYIGVIKNIETGAERELSRAVASVSPTGRYALSINFSRLFNFRPGYGYAGIPDEFDSVDHPEDDGIFLIDLNTGESRLIVSLAQIHNASPDMTADARLVVNHITFNRDGARFLFLPRTNPRETGRGWRTAIFTSDLTGNDLYCLHDYIPMISHYNWRDPASAAFFCQGESDNTMYLLTDKTRNMEAIDSEYFTWDGHCSYSPDGRWLLYDSYPMDGYRYLYLYDLQKREGKTLGGFYSVPVDNIDIRCDLHPRWSNCGRKISFDSTHEGSRHVYVMDISSIVG